MGVAFAADALGFGGLPGLGTRQVTLALSGLALFEAGLTMILPLSQRKFSFWLLILTAVLAVALASDLIVINTGLPGTIEKTILIGVLMVCVLLARGYVDYSNGTLIETGRARLLAIDRVAVLKFLMVAVQFGLLVVMIGEFNLENEVFSYNIMLLVFFGFLVHFLLPLDYRRPFFLLLSLTGILGVFGITDGGWLLLLGLVLIGITLLPYYSTSG